MADNIATTLARNIATDEATYSGDTAHIQVSRPAHVAGAEGAKTVEAVTQTVGSAVPAAAVLMGGTDGTNTRHLRTDTNGRAEVMGNVAHSAGIAGNPMTMSGVSIDVDDTAPPNRVDAEADATRIGVDRDGSVFVRTHGPQLWSYHFNGSTAQTDTTVKAAPGAGLSLYVSSITFSSGAATAINAFFEEGASTVLGPFYLEAVAGRGMHLTFPTPKKITANTALTWTSSAAIAHSLDVMGYTAQG